MPQPAHELPSNARTAVTEALNDCLADTAVATTLSQNFHWNVTGPHFGALHALFEEIYTDHFAGQDELAERVRALQGTAVGRLRDMLDRTKVSEGDPGAGAMEMVAAMTRAEETVAAGLAATAELAAEHGDALTEDLCIARGQVHEKFAWMLRAHLA